MIPPTGETFKKETLDKENTREGRGEAWSRHAMVTDEPAGQIEGSTDRHVELISPQNSDPALLPHPCPPSGAKEANVTITMKRCLQTSLQAEDCLTPLKKRNLDPDYLHCEIKTAPSPNPEKTEHKDEVEWNFINENNYRECIMKSDKEVLDYIKQNLDKLYYKLITSNYKKNDFKNIFLQMFKKHQPMSVKKKKYRQQAFAILKKKENFKLSNDENTGERSLNDLIEVIGPFEPKRKKHSEDFIIEEIKKRNNISEVWLYTTNSPCLGRKCHSPCMSNLINLATNYNIKIFIGFSKHYICIRNMYNCYQNLKDWNSDHKFQVQFNMKELIFKCEKHMKIKDNNLITAACNIIMNILSKYSGLEKKYKDWHQTGAETLAELESTLIGEMEERGVMMKSSDEEFRKILDEYKKWWTLSIDENLNRHVVPSILENIHDFCPNIEFFQVDLDDCLNLANEE